MRYWLKHGHLIPLKRGVYVLSEDLRKGPLSMGFLSNYLLSPSYVSLEYALSYYDLIPEKVLVYTSITTKKTTEYTAAIGKFNYHSVKESLFGGFTKSVDNGQSYFIAYPEKALLDFFYFHRELKGAKGEFESYRFQNLEILNFRRFDKLKTNYNKKTNTIARSFIKFCKLEKKRYKALK
ncbi:MAG: hypothetical protein NTX01_01010 [Candidatus Omnitrophica bacterium]|nr:hypothetical protein [Candidatus Omnitrophota bacterium]